MKTKVNCSECSLQQKCNDSLFHARVYYGDPCTAYRPIRSRRHKSAISALSFFIWSAIIALAVAFLFKAVYALWPNAY